MADYGEPISDQEKVDIITILAFRDHNKLYCLMLTDIKVCFATNFIIYSNGYTSISTCFYAGMNTEVKKSEVTS